MTTKEGDARVGKEQRPPAEAPPNIRRFANVGPLERRFSRAAFSPTGSRGRSMSAQARATKQANTRIRPGKHLSAGPAGSVDSRGSARSEAVAYDPALDRWDLETTRLLPLYPRMHVLPGGQHYYSGVGSFSTRAR